eukprot:5175399-Alexandrium_andersonii.AAC.1
MIKAESGAKCFMWRTVQLGRPQVRRDAYTVWLSRMLRVSALRAHGVARGVCAHAGVWRPC